MGFERPILFLWSVISITALLVVTLKAADPLCEGLTPDEIFPFPHEYNCSLFYECLNGEKITVECPNGFYYNEATQACDFPELSGCTNGHPQCFNITLDYFPHPDDCTRYIECWEGDAYLMVCPNGYWFDSRQKRCVLPDDSDCGKTTSPTTSTTTTSTTTTPTTTTVLPICWDVGPNQVVLKRYEGDCQKYWRCDGLQESLEGCYAHLFFDEEKKLCDFPEIVNCDGSTRTPDPATITPPSIEPITPSGEDPRCVEPGVTYWPHPAFCNYYIECFYGASYEMYCPSGFHFADELNTCIDPALSGCTRIMDDSESANELPNDLDCSNPESESKLMPYPGECNKYYECVQGTKVTMLCSKGLSFNPDRLKCDYPYQASCQWEQYSLLDIIHKYFLWM